MSKAFWYRMLPLTGLIILGVLVYRVGIENILSAFTGLRYELLLILPFLLALMLIVQTLKWQLILQHQQVAVPFLILFRLNLMGIFYGTITPGRAGVLLKAGYLADYCKKPVSKLSSSVIIDKVLELIVLGGFATIGSLLIAKSIGATAFLFAASVTVVLVIISLAFYRETAARYVTCMLSFRGVPPALQGRLKKEVDRFYANLPGKASLLAPLLLTVSSWLLIWTQAFAVARALSMTVSYGLFIAIVSVGSLVSLVPITINGIGTREAALVAMLYVYGVAPEKTLAMSLLSLSLCGYLPALLGALQTGSFAKVEGDRAH